MGLMFRVVLPADHLNSSHIAITETESGGYYANTVVALFLRLP